MSKVDLVAVLFPNVCFGAAGFLGLALGSDQIP